MTHRNLFPSPQMPVMDSDQIWSHPHPNPHSHLGEENGTFMLPVHGASTPVSRAIDYPSSSFSNYMATNSGLIHDPYLHPSSTASSSQFPPPSFNQHMSSMAPQTEIARTLFEWKSPAIHPALNGSNTSGYYTAGNSSNLHIDPLQPMSFTRSWPLDPSSITHNYDGDNLLPAGEEFQRNVRPRRDHTFQVDINPSSDLPRHFTAAGNLSGLNMEGQFSHAPTPIAPQGRIYSSDYSFSYGRNQFLSGAGVINNTVETTSSLPSLHGPLTRGVEDGSSGNSQTANPYRSSSSHTSVGFPHGSLEGGGPSGMEFVASSRYYRPVSITGNNSYRNGRTRSSYGRFQLNYDEDSVHSRWLSEGAVMMDRSTFYDSRNLFDQHREMRLDVDSMSYEELLSLGERIGNVSTGLSEENISTCLQQMTRCSSNQIEVDQEGGRCVICLEEYEDQDKVGRLSCRHDFHVGCIKNWLLIKNACPICKAAAFGDRKKSELDSL